MLGWDSPSDLTCSSLRYAVLPGTREWWLHMQVLSELAPFQRETAGHQMQARGYIRKLLDIFNVNTCLTLLVCRRLEQPHPMIDLIRHAACSFKFWLQPSGSSLCLLVTRSSLPGAPEFGWMTGWPLHSFGPENFR